MKCKIISVVLIFVMIMLALICFNEAYNTPNIPQKTVIDIRNESTEDITNMYLKVVVPETFKYVTDNDYYTDEIVVPMIKKKERIILMLDQNQVSLPGMQLSLRVGESTKIIVDELHKDVGDTIIVKIEKSESLIVKKVYNNILQKKDIFYHKRYERIINLNEQLDN